MDRYFQIGYTYRGIIRIKAKNHKDAEGKVNVMFDKGCLKKGFVEFDIDYTDEIEKEKFDNSKKDEIHVSCDGDKVRLMVYIPANNLGKGEITTRKKAEKEINHLSSMQPENHYEIRELE